MYEMSVQSQSYKTNTTADFWSSKSLSHGQTQWMLNKSFKERDACFHLYISTYLHVGHVGAFGGLKRVSDAVDLE